MNCLLDANILLAIVRAKDYKSILKFLNVDDSSIYISIVSEAEIKSMGFRNQWGRDRLSLLDYFLTQVTIVEVSQILINSYVQIEAYSQRSNPDFESYLFSTSRNMGKNDLWIASVAASMNQTLITTDSDFDHLDGIFLDVRKIDVKEFLPFFK